MAQYYPKSQIITNLYTDGGEFILSTTGENYIGDYYSTSNGVSYTGKNPKDGESIPILRPSLFTSNENITSDASTPGSDIIVLSTNINPNVDIGDNNYKLVEDYLKLPISSKQSKRKIPQNFYPQPTESDYQFKEFQRYFCKKNNELIYIEINAETYRKLSSNNSNIASEMYTPFQITWTISGEERKVFNINKRVVSTFERNNRSLYGFSAYFKNNFTQFFKPEVKENLFTDGGEYATKDGKEYIGDYHIHPEKGPMVGAIHVTTPHEYLYPIGSPFTGSIFTPSISSTPSYSPPASSGGGGSGY